VAALLLWTVVWPSWQIWRASPVRQQALVQSMQQLQAQVSELARLRALPAGGTPTDRTSQQQALQALTARWLGAEAKLVNREDGWEVQISAAPAPSLAHWLVAVRESLALRVQHLRLERTAPEAWQGSVTLTPVGVDR
jgi:type II secretory pathway component PulM